MTRTHTHSYCLLLRTAPDKPEISTYEYADNSVEVTWDEAEDGKDAENPGSEYYIKYRIQGQWSRSAHRAVSSRICRC